MADPGDAMKPGLWIGLALLVALAAGFWGGWSVAARRAEEHANVLRAVVDSQGRALDSASAGLQTASASAGTWIDSVRVLLAKIRTRARPTAATDTPPAPADTLPLPTGPELVTGLVEACDSLAVTCQAVRDSAAKLDTLAHQQHDSIATLLGRPQPVAPLPVTIHVGDFKTGALVGAGGTAALVGLLYLLFHH